MALPPAPEHEEARDACCDKCGSLFHTTEGHALDSIGQDYAVTGSEEDGAAQ